MPPQKPKSSPRIYPPRPTPELPPEVVDPIWLLKALGISFAAALLCAYATLCLLFYQGEWQLILHPTHTVDRTPTTVGLAYNDVHLDSAETGQPRLSAWWIPATPTTGFQPGYATPTILYLHDGSGSLSDTMPVLSLLHSAGANIFAIDYRGFGTSDSSHHPSETSMTEDTAAALDYLTATRHIPAPTIIPYGTGLAASLAANLAHTRPRLPAFILDNPIPDPAAIAVAAHPSHLVPVRLLFGNQFNIATPLASLATPKLLISGGPTAPTPQPDPNALQSLFTHAASPRTTVSLPDRNTSQAYLQTLSQFFDQHLPRR
ncbi:MAG TPA: alpha/beta fold hydrolase [Acidobacteriaceae bacterium]|nr:alpha/beta fold hydrolase [Acidobacteriaceae bacterium]